MNKPKPIFFKNLHRIQPISFPTTPHGLLLSHDPGVYTVARSIGPFSILSLKKQYRRLLTGLQTLHHFQPLLKSVGYTPAIENAHNPVPISDNDILGIRKWLEPQISQAVFTFHSEYLNLDLPSTEFQLSDSIGLETETSSSESNNDDTGFIETLSNFKITILLSPSKSPLTFPISKSFNWNTLDFGSIFDSQILLTENEPPILSKPCSVWIGHDLRESAWAKDSAWATIKKDIMKNVPDYIEDVLLIREGDIYEGMGSNVFSLASDGVTVYTAPHDGSILNGSIRELVINMFKNNDPNLKNLRLKELPPHLGSIKSWKGAFLTSTSRLVKPISEICVMDDLNSSPKHSSKHSWSATHPSIKQIQLALNKILVSESEEVPFVKNWILSNISK